MKRLLLAVPFLLWSLGAFAQVQGGGLVGPSVSVSGHCAYFSGTTGQILADSGFACTGGGGGPFLPLAGGTLSGGVTFTSLTNGTLNLAGTTISGVSPLSGSIGATPFSLTANGGDASGPGFLLAGGTRTTSIGSSTRSIISGVSGLSSGTAKGGAMRVIGGNGSAGATGDGGDAEAFGADSLSTNGNGGNLLLKGGAKTGSGHAGVVGSTTAIMVASSFTSGSTSAFSFDDQLGSGVNTTGLYTINGTQIAAANLSDGNSGTGSIAHVTSPTFVTPTLGVATKTATIAGGTKFTTSGCSISATTGGGTAGIMTSGTTGTCTPVVTLNGATGVTAPTGWACSISNQTTANLIRQTASTTTTVTFSGVTVTGDVLVFGCVGY